MEIELSINVSGVFDHFSRIYEITKFSLTKLCIDVSDIIPAIEHT